MYKSTFTKGYSLVEVLVAISILMLSIAGPLTIASKGLQSSYYARDQLTASMLAQEGIEAVTAIRNERLLVEIGQTTPVMTDVWDWVTNSNSYDPCFTANGCNIDFSDSSLANNVVTCGSGNCLMKFTTNNGQRAKFNNTTGSDSPFTRVIKLTDVDPGLNNEVSVDVTVSWKPSVFGGATRSVTLSSSLFNVYGK